MGGSLVACLALSVMPVAAIFEQGEENETEDSSIIRGQNDRCLWQQFLLTFLQIPSSFNGYLDENWWHTDCLSDGWHDGRLSDSSASKTSCHQKAWSAHVWR